MTLATVAYGESDLTFDPGKAPLSYLGWLLAGEERTRLLLRFPPRYPVVYAHHVTLRYPAERSDPLPLETDVRIVGMADDGKGLEALVVEIGGVARRPDGGWWHITWSLDRAAGYEPWFSNDVIRDHGCESLAEPLAIRLEPMFFDQGTST